MKFIIVGYRDSYFWNDYGTSVRDLQVAEILSRENEVIFINRPVSIYERVTNKSFGRATYKKYSDRITFVDSTSYDLIGPLKGRLWTEKCYRKIFEKVVENYAVNFEGKIIVIDFTPLANLEYKNIKNVYYWYDLIDNFSIHNRFTDKEKLIVKQKYDYVNENADIITGVSDKALHSFSNKNVYVMPNGVYFEPCDNDEGRLESHLEKYQLGFVGFITDKFDVDFVNNISSQYSVVIWGKFFDENIRQKLNRNIKIGGPFKYSDLSTIMKTFQIGLLPYLPIKSHDESPLKMYEYFKHGIPCISSMDFEIKNKWFSNYLGLNYDELCRMINSYLENSDADNIRASIKDEWSFDNKVKSIISKLR